MRWRRPSIVVAVAAGFVAWVAVASCGQLTAAGDVSDSSSEVTPSGAPEDAAEEGFDPGDLDARAQPFDAAAVPPGAKIVFVSSSAPSGNLGGPTGATAECQKLAAKVPGLASRSFVALVRGNTPPGPATWVRVDGKTAFVGAPSLDSPPTLALAIDLTEQGAIPLTSDGTHAGAWTGAADQTCSNWSIGAGSGQPKSVTGGSGNTGATDPTWLNAGPYPCIWQRRLYCFEK